LPPSVAAAADAAVAMETNLSRTASTDSLDGRDEHRFERDDAVKMTKIDAVGMVGRA